MLAILAGLLVISSRVSAQTATAAEDQPPSPPPPPSETAEAVPPAPPAPPVPATAVPAAAAAEGPSLHFDVPDPDRTLSGPIDFSGAPVQAVLDYYARLTNRSIIQAPTVTGTIVFRSQTQLTVREAIQALDSVLAINGVAVVPLGDKFLKVVQIATGKQEGPPVLTEGGRLAGGDALVTQIIQLKHAEATEVGAALQPYIHAYGQLQPFTKSNSIFITDTAANIKRMLEIVEFLDAPSPLRMETKVFELTNAGAEDVAAKLKAIIQETEQLVGASAAGQAATRRVLPRTTTQRATPTPTQPAAAGEGQSIIEGKVIITADERTNKLFVLSRPSNFPFFEELIKELDARVDPEFITRVLALDYADSEDLAALLNSLITGSSLPAAASRTQGQGERTPVAPARALSAAAEAVAVGMFELADRLRVLPDPRTNSLLVMATHGDMQRVEELVRALDESVAQVLIEVVIAEVNLSGNLEVGVDWFKRQFKEGQLISGGGSDNFDGLTPKNLTTEGIDLATDLASGGLTYYFTLKNMRMDGVIRLLSGSSRFKVLSTPILQTMHNQEADIIVGESRPILTQTVSDLGTGISTDTFRSNVEYRDVAIELKVTPRINPEGYVTMEVEQKINDIAGLTAGEPNLTPTITKREARSVVVVRDQGTVVLGGLIREDKSVGETKVPILGDIPVLGSLFKSNISEKRRTELIVFIRPNVLRTDAATNEAARNRAMMLKVGEELGLDKIFDGKATQTDDEFTIEELEKERKLEAEQKP